MGAILLSLALALAPEDDARALADKAEAAFKADDFATAVEHARAAYKAYPDPFYLFILAMAERNGGDCPSAVEHFKQFLAASSNTDAGDARAVAQKEIDGCEDLIGDPTPKPVPAPAPVPPPEATPTPAPTQPLGPQRTTADRPWHRDPTAVTLLVVGSAAVATGVSVLAAAYGLESRAAGRPGSEDAYEDAFERSKRLEISSVPLLTVGAALLVGAGIRYAIVRRRG